MQEPFGVASGKRQTELQMVGRRDPEIPSEETEPPRVSDPVTHFGANLLNTTERTPDIFPGHSLSILLTDHPLPHHPCQW